MGGTCSRAGDDDRGDRDGGAVRGDAVVKQVSFREDAEVDGDARDDDDDDDDDAAAGDAAVEVGTREGHDGGEGVDARRASVVKPVKSALRAISALPPVSEVVMKDDEDEDARVDPAVLRALRDTLAAILPSSMGHTRPATLRATSTMSAYRAASRTYEGERVDRERTQSGGERPASMRLQSVREEPDALLLDNRSDEEIEEMPVKEKVKQSIEDRVREARREDQRRLKQQALKRANAERAAKTTLNIKQEGTKNNSTRWTTPKRTAYERKLDHLLAVAERAGVSAERVNQEICDLNERVESGVVAVQPWEEKGNSWAAERSKSALSERSSSAGTILQPKALKTTRVEGKSLESGRVAEEPKVVTSILRSDLLKAMGEMSAEEKLSRLGLAPVPESTDLYDDDLSEHATMGTPMSLGRSQSTPGSRRRAWNERSPVMNRDDADDNYSDGDHFLTPPPAPASSVKSQSQTYVDKLKAQAKLAKLESSRSWKAGVGVVGGQHS